MRFKENTLIIHLHEIPKDGKSWTFDQTHREAVAVLSDIVEGAPFAIQLFIEPLGNTSTFSLSGSFTAQWPEDCSRCGESFKYKSAEKFNHMLMPKVPAARDEKTTKPNHISDTLVGAEGAGEGPEVFEYVGNNFDVGQFLHEILALAKPLIPAPSVDCNGQCTECKISVKNQDFSYDEPMVIKREPFASLKSFKLN